MANRDKDEITLQKIELEKMIMPEFRPELVDYNRNLRHSFFEQLEATPNKLQFYLKTVVNRCESKAKNLLGVTISEVENYESIGYQALCCLNPPKGMSKEDRDFRVALLGMSIASHDTSLLLSRHAGIRIEQLSKNWSNGRRLQRQQLAIAALIAKLFSEVYLPHNNTTYRYKQGDLYEAIHQRILSYLRSCKSMKIKKLFETYRSRTPNNDDAFATSYYSPSTKFIAETVSELTPKQDEYCPLSELESLRGQMNVKAIDLDLPGLEKLLKDKISNKEISTFLDLKISELG